MPTEPKSDQQSPRDDVPETPTPAGQTEPAPTGPGATLPGPSSGAHVFANVSGDEGVSVDTSSPEGSDYFSDGDSDFTSLSSGAVDYTYENGRRYHAYSRGKYVLPNDEEEKDRLDLVHHIFKLILHGECHLAPIQNPQNILDLGTGTGIWALDVADMYPSASVIGTDLSPIQPTYVAPNVEFLVDDFEQDWVFGKKFDLVHGRTLLGSVQDWPELFSKAYQHIKPGGWIEFQEAPIWCWSDDGSLKPDSPLIQFLTILKEESSKINRSMNVADQLATWMTAAGFTHVTEKQYFIPWTPWPRDRRLKAIGMYQFHNVLDSVDSYGLALLTRGRGYTEEQALVFIALVKQQLRSKGLHIYGIIYNVYGQKPLEAGE